MGDRAILKQPICLHSFHIVYFLLFPKGLKPLPSEERGLQD